MIDRVLLRAERAPSPLELLAVGVALTLVAAAAYGAWLGVGGFYSDDWANAAGYRFAEAPRYWSSVGDLASVLGGRPLLAVFLPIPHALFGVAPGPHLALALALGIATSLCLYVLLRTLEMAPVHAAAIAALSLLFPWSDSIRLWPTASINSLSVCFFLIGLVVALRGFDHRGRRAIAMHGGADVLYLLSVLTYEASAAAALLAGFLYIGRGSPASVGKRWAADVAVVFGALVYSLATTVSSRHVGSPLERLEDMGPFGRESMLLLASALEPGGTIGRPIQALVLALAAGVVAAALFRLRRHADPVLRAWLRWIVIAVAGVGAAYAVFLGSHLHPLDPGIDNRINVYAGLAYCLLAYSVVACAARLVFRSPLRAAATTVAVAIAIGAGYAVRLADDQSAWQRASERQVDLLDSAEHGLLPLPPESTVLSFGVPAQTAPEVPIFNRSWDLSGALRIRSGRPSLHAFPVFEGVEVRCGPGLSVDGGAGYGAYRLGYGRLFFLDPELGARQIRSRRQCANALSRFRPGPLEA